MSADDDKHDRLAELLAEINAECEESSDSEVRTPRRRSDSSFELVSSRLHSSASSIYDNESINEDSSPEPSAAQSSSEPPEEPSILGGSNLGTSVDTEHDDEHADAKSLSSGDSPPSTRQAHQESQTLVNDDLTAMEAPISISSAENSGLLVDEPTEQKVSVEEQSKSAPSNAQAEAARSKPSKDADSPKSETARGNGPVREAADSAQADDLITKKSKQNSSCTTGSKPSSSIRLDSAKTQPPSSEGEASEPKTAKIGATSDKAVLKATVTTSSESGDPLPEPGKDKLADSEDYSRAETNPVEPQSPIASREEVEEEAREVAKATEPHLDRPGSFNSSNESAESPSVAETSFETSGASGKPHQVSSADKLLTNFDVDKSESSDVTGQAAVQESTSKSVAHAEFSREDGPRALAETNQDSKHSEPASPSATVLLREAAEERHFEVERKEPQEYENDSIDLVVDEECDRQPPSTSGIASVHDQEETSSQRVSEAHSADSKIDGDASAVLGRENFENGSPSPPSKTVTSDEETGTACKVPVEQQKSSEGEAQTETEEETATTSEAPPPQDDSQSDTESTVAVAGPSEGNDLGPVEEPRQSKIEMDSDLPSKLATGAKEDSEKKPNEPYSAETGPASVDDAVERDFSDSDAKLTRSVNGSPSGEKCKQDDPAASHVPPSSALEPADDVIRQDEPRSGTKQSDTLKDSITGIIVSRASVDNSAAEGGRDLGDPLLESANISAEHEGPMGDSAAISKPDVQEVLPVEKPQKTTSVPSDSSAHLSSAPSDGPETDQAAASSSKELPKSAYSEVTESSLKQTPHPADDPNTVFIYVSFASGVRGTMARYNRAVTILESHGIKFTTVEITMDDRAKRFWKYKGASKNKLLPAIVRDGDLKCDFNELLEANECEDVEGTIFDGL